MVDTAQLVAEVKTKGVRKATDELDRFGKEAGKADKSTAKFKKGATAAFGAVKVGAIALTGATAALTALTVKVAAAQKEWQTLSNIAGDSVDNFKATAFAAEQVGISAEKLADISKDTNEKLGEFIATGGGGFKDFFEQVAPQVNLTAKELQGLSGPQVLGRVKSALDAANVPLEQQSFYLESIASDTTNLIPLLANEGAELNRLTGEYNKLNDALALTASDQKGLTNLSKEFNLLTDTGANALAFLTSQFAPDLAVFINFVTQSIPTATAAVASFFDEFRDPENRRSIESVQETIAENLLEIEQLEKNSAKSRSNASSNEVRALKTENQLLNERLEILKKEQASSVTAPTFGGGSAFTPSTGTAESAAEKQKAIEEDLFAYRIQLAQDFNNEQDRLNLEYLNGIDARRQQELAIQQETFNATSEIFGSLAQLQSTFGEESSGTYKALFAAQQAFNIASAISNIQTAAVAAAADPSAVTLGQKIGNYGTLLAALTPSIAAIKNAGDFANGGIIGGGSFAGDNITANVNSGEMILNRGQQKNLFDIANGGGGGGPNVTVINNAPNSVARAETMSDGRVKVIVEEVLNSAVLSPNSSFNKNLDRTRKVQRQL